MTREEFLDNICNLDDLYNFCSENDAYEFFDDRCLHSYDSFEDWVCEYYYEDLYQNCNWEEMRCELNNIRELMDNYEWFDTSDYEPSGVSQRGYHYDEIKQEVYEWACDNGIFDDDEEEGEHDREEIERLRETQQQCSDTQVKWGIVREKHEEESIFIPQDDMSLLMF